VRGVVAASQKQREKYALSAHTRQKSGSLDTRNALRFFFCPSASFPFQLTYFGDEREMCLGLTAFALLCFVSSAVCFVVDLGTTFCTSEAMNSNETTKTRYTQNYEEKPREALQILADEMFDPVVYLKKKTLDKNCRHCLN
jgi:hypothetical protein